MIASTAVREVLESMVLDLYALFSRVRAPTNFVDKNCIVDQEDLEHFEAIDWTCAKRTDYYDCIDVFICLTPRSLHFLSPAIIRLIVQGGSDGGLEVNIYEFFTRKILGDSDDFLDYFSDGQLSKLADILKTMDTALVSVVRGFGTDDGLI